MKRLYELLTHVVAKEIGYAYTKLFIEGIYVRTLYLPRQKVVVAFLYEPEMMLSIGDDMDRAEIIMQEVPQRLALEGDLQFRYESISHKVHSDPDLLAHRMKSRLFKNIHELEREQRGDERHVRGN